jgi:hypothetical protein
MSDYVAHLEQSWEQTKDEPRMSLRCSNTDPCAGIPEGVTAGLRQPIKFRHQKAFQDAGHFIPSHRPILQPLFRRVW